MHNPEKLIADFMELVRHRAEEESRILSARTNRLSAFDAEHKQAITDLDSRMATDREQSEAEYATLKQEILAEYEAHTEQAEKEARDAQVAVNATYTSSVNEATREFDDATWMVNSVFDKSAEDSPAHRFDLARARSKKEKEYLEVQAAELQKISDEADQLMRRRKMGTSGVVQGGEIRASGSDELHEIHVSSTAQAGEALSKLKKLWLPRQFAGIRPFFPALLAWAVAVPGVVAVRSSPSLLFSDPSAIEEGWLGASLAIAAGIAALVMLVLYGVARGRSVPLFNSIKEELYKAAAARREWAAVSKRELKLLKAAGDKWNTEQKAKLKRALGKATNTKDHRLNELHEKRDSALAAINERYARETKSIGTRRDRRLREANERFPALNNSINNRLSAQRELMTRNYEESRTKIQDELQQQWSALTERWRSGCSAFISGTKTLTRRIRDGFPSWDRFAQEWVPPRQAPDEIPIGTFTVDVAELPGGVSDQDELQIEPTRFSTPSLLTFPDEMSLLLETGTGGRREAIDLLQNVMLRLLTSLPPGKVRFTIVDPVGLGENFSAFMHLADYDEVLVTNRIWTEEQQINKRLLDLTEHMENVFQTYLRNEFGTIQEYNIHAGEVAEPYHFLVVANFPVGFSDEAARRLTSIMSSGPRCGVHTLLSIDPRQEMPRGFNAADLNDYAARFIWEQQRFVWQHSVFQSLPMTLDQPPGPGDFSQIVRNVGNESRDARHVQVPFDLIAPGGDKLWSQDSRKGIDVPLGRAGATKLQHLNLGRGTAQHVMIAGKTGSGKSTLLHILITNLALHYSADEVEFYLIDFKKGVEFKTYASHQLPHARVIAIESDREFGVSVLDRLDRVLAERGDLFRSMGVQDIAAFRDAQPDAVMPRILLVIDEFQEFFVDDDQIAQRASLLLDRLVRQGRAFGIHVLLGSQTLGGAYSLARSTMGQIGVRIALQCSEADSHLILSEENTAARLLARPGEAIYNDSNGSVEGNHPFQIAWLDEERRERFLNQLLADRGATPQPMVVFEGNVPAQPHNNSALSEVIRAGSPARSPAAVRLWLGEPVAIKESTSIPLRRQSGHNLLIVGQNEGLARGTLLMAAISAAAQVTPESASVEQSVSRFYVFHGADRHEDDRVWQTLSDAVPHAVRTVGLRETATVVSELRAEIARRDEAGIVDAPPVYVIVYGLSRFRDLRKDDDDFGFGGFDSGEARPAAPSKLFAEVLKEGPSLGVHVLTWCDTYSNATRWLSTASMRECELRVGFQMNSTDSANLIDSPAAARLGPNRALLYVEEIGAAEKFRPYGTPNQQWIRETGLSIGDDAAVRPPESALEPEKRVDSVAESLDGWTIE